MSLADYEKIKAKRTQMRFSIHYPWPIKLLLGVPLALLIALVLWYVLYARFLPEH